MVLFTLASVIGLLGRGPYSHETIRSATGAMSIDYEPITRQDTATTVTVHLKRSPGASDPIELQLNQQMVEPMGYRRSIPLADSTRLSDGGMRLTFSAVPDKSEVLVRFELRPTEVGIRPLRVSDGTESLHWSLLVVP